MDKIRVAVLYGGCSAEHEISLHSALSVIEAADKERFEIIPIGIDKSGNWFLGYDVFHKSIEQNKVINKEKNIPTCFNAGWLNKPFDKNLILNSQTKNFDVVFPAMHGTLCEDGALQGLLELANIPYVGANVVSSAIGMDKEISKRLALQAGIPVAPYLVLKKEECIDHFAAIVQYIEETLTYPLFVKPANTGSSIGISKVKSRDFLKNAMEVAFRYDAKILIEKGLDVTELEIGVLASKNPNTQPIISEVGEVRPNDEFYSYQSKYILENGALLLIPAEISDQDKIKAKQMAEKIFAVLNCDSMARVDLFLERNSNQLLFNEINTLPGFTNKSMFPKLMKTSGYTMTALVTHLIDLAIKRHKIKNALSRNYQD